jgi:hypothetical protein
MSELTLKEQKGLGGIQASGFEPSGSFSDEGPTSLCNSQAFLHLGLPEKGKTIAPQLVSAAQSW